MLFEIVTIIQWISWTTYALMVTHFTFIFLTLACLLLTYFIARLQGYFHLCIKINEYHSSLQNKTTVGEKLYFPICRTRIQESQLLFYLLLLLIPRFLPSLHLSLWHGLVYDFTLWETAHVSAQEKQKSCRQLCVAQRLNMWTSKKFK